MREEEISLWDNPYQTRRYQSSTCLSSHMWRTVLLMRLFTASTTRIITILFLWFWPLLQLLLIWPPPYPWFRSNGLCFGLEPGRFLKGLGLLLHAGATSSEISRITLYSSSHNSEFNTFNIHAFSWALHGSGKIIVDHAKESATKCLNALKWLRNAQFCFPRGRWRSLIPSDAKKCTIQEASMSFGWRHFSQKKLCLMNILLAVMLTTLMSDKQSICSAQRMSWTQMSCLQPLRSNSSDRPVSVSVSPWRTLRKSRDKSQ